MPDVYATIQQQSRAIVETIARAMEVRGLSAATRDSGAVFPDKARVLEIGCGSGPIAEVLAQWPGVAEVVGVDPSPVLSLGGGTTIRDQRTCQLLLGFDILVRCR